MKQKMPLYDLGGVVATDVFLLKELEAQEPVRDFPPEIRLHENYPIDRVLFISSGKD
jgi:hypothetical protein